VFTGSRWHTGASEFGEALPPHVQFALLVNEGVEAVPQAPCVVGHDEALVLLVQGAERLLHRFEARVLVRDALDRDLEHCRTSRGVMLLFREVELRPGVASYAEDCTKK
jgi:hypothetical protein